MPELTVIKRATPGQRVILIPRFRRGSTPDIIGTVDRQDKLNLAITDHEGICHALAPLDWFICPAPEGYFGIFWQYSHPYVQQYDSYAEGIDDLGRLDSMGAAAKLTLWGPDGKLAADGKAISDYGREHHADVADAWYQD